MTATQTHPTPPNPTIATDLADLRRLGLTVARLASTLAGIEQSTLEALAETTATAATALVAPATLADALNAGRDADACEAARENAIKRMTTIAAAFNEAARTVRRTAALELRLANTRGNPEPPPPGPRAASWHPAAPRPARDAERPDRPETGDELGTMTDDEALRSIHLCIARADSKVARLTHPLIGIGADHPAPTPANPTPANPTPANPTAPDPAPDARPTAIPPATAPPAPDT